MRSVVLVEGRVQVKEWVKKGRRRLYFSVGGEQVGWYDLVNNRGELLFPEFSRVFVVEVVRRGGERDAVLGVVGVAGRRERVDLSLNGAGVAAQREGERLKRAGASEGEVKSWLLGAAGERKMGELFKKLPSSWRVLHSVPIGVEGSDIDHFLVSPAGVFTVNTKTHPGAVVECSENRVQVRKGRWHKVLPYARNSRFEARRVRGLLKKRFGVDLPVVGVVAYWADEVMVLSLPKDEKVVNVQAGGVLGFLLSQPKVLGEGDVEKVWEFVRWGGLTGS